MVAIGRTERAILSKAAAWFARETDTIPPKASSSRLGRRLELPRQLFRRASLPNQLDQPLPELRRVRMKVGDVTEVEANIHAGTKYMRFMIDQYYEKEPMTKVDKALFAFASYNAGPARVRQLRQEASKRGLDPNVWFQNVEYVAAEKVGQETVTYVSNIYKYYIAYRLVTENREAAHVAVEKIKSGAK